MAPALRFYYKKPFSRKPSVKVRYLSPLFVECLHNYRGLTTNTVRIVPSMQTSPWNNLLTYANSLNRPEFFSSSREILTSLDPDDSPDTQAEAASEVRPYSRSLPPCQSRNVARSRSISCTEPAIRIRYCEHMASISSLRRSLSPSLFFSNSSRRRRWPSSYSFSTRWRCTASCSISSIAPPAASRAIIRALCLPTGDKPCRCGLEIISAPFKMSHAAVEVAALNDDWK